MTMRSLTLYKYKNHQAQIWTPDSIAEAMIGEDECGEQGTLLLNGSIASAAKDTYEVVGWGWGLLVDECFSVFLPF
jgi:hypothetical protein